MIKVSIKNGKIYKSFVYVLSEVITILKFRDSEIIHAAVEIFGRVSNALSKAVGGTFSC